MIYVAEEDDALNMKMCFHNNAGADNSKDFDMLVQLKMSSLQCVFINEFLMDILVRENACLQSIHRGQYYKI